MSSFKRLRYLIPGALIAAPLLFAAPAMASTTYTSTVKATCVTFSGSSIGYCEALSVALPSAKTWTAVSGSAKLSGQSIVLYPSWHSSGTVLTETFTLTASDGTTATFKVYIKY